MPPRIDTPPSRAAQCRKNAYYCGMLAGAAPTWSDRIKLLDMRRGWLALAENEAWLAAEQKPLDSQAA